MRQIRLHTGQALENNARIRLDSAPARHLVQVLRRPAGSDVVLFNGDGLDYPAVILETGKPDKCLLEIGQARRPNTESPLALMLIQAIGRGERMDYTIQKSVELGVTAVHPVMTARTGVRLEGKRAANRLAHWKGVATAACEQSGRARIPEIHAPASLADALSDLPQATMGLFLDPAAKLGPAALDDPPPGGVVLVIGPEGGFDEDEKSFLAAAGFTGLRLGPRVLRTETAGPAAITALQIRFGDLG